MKRKMRVSLKVKILGLVILLIAFIIGSLSLMFIYMKYRDDIVKVEELSLQTAKNAIVYTFTA